MLGDQIVLSPMLLGSEPVTAEAGVYKGTTVLREEEAEGWAFMAALTPEQRKKALIGMDLPFDGYASGFKDNIVVPYDGLPASEMTPQQRDAIRHARSSATPTGCRGGHAQVRLDEVRRISMRRSSPGSANSIRSARSITASTVR